MLIAKGSNVRLVLADGRSVRAPGGMLHDPNGKAWPRCSVLVGPFQKGREPIQKDLGARKYFGADYNASLGSANIPDDKNLDGWKKVGDVRQIFYVRTGNVYGGTLFQHPFKPHAKLYRLGKWHRLELGSWCSLDEAGFRKP